MWLLKSEPNDYSYQDLVKEGKTKWDGVKNHQAVNNMKKMEKGEKVFFYHTGRKREIVGVCEVSKESYDDGEYTVVEVMPVKELENPVTLKEIKEDDFFSDWALVRQGRLSVVPVKKEYWNKVIEMSESK
ncbi:MAG: EVE domain-containing protein [Clostridia bacterium]